MAEDQLPRDEIAHCSPQRIAPCPAPTAPPRPRGPGVAGQRGVGDKKHSFGDPETKELQEGGHGWGCPRPWPIPSRTGAMASRQGAGTPKGKGLLPLPREALVVQHPGTRHRSNTPGDSAEGMAGERGGGLTPLCLSLARCGAIRMGVSPPPAWQLSRGGTRRAFASSCGEGLFFQLK